MLSATRQAWRFGHGPAFQHAVEFEPQHASA
jgi:hypothetical protein